jgi:hypothetical protein
MLSFASPSVPGRMSRLTLSRLYGKPFLRFIRRWKMQIPPAGLRVAFEKGIAVIDVHDGFPSFVVKTVLPADDGENEP